MVGINVQPDSILDGVPFACQEWMGACTVRTLPVGSRLRTYEESRVPTAEGDGIRVVAELLSSERGIRVVAGATNGFDLPANRWDVTRPEPVLSQKQLTRIVTQSWWGFRLPASGEVCRAR